MKEHKDEIQLLINMATGHKRPFFEVPPWEAAMSASAVRTAASQVGAPDITAEKALE